MVDELTAVRNSLTTAVRNTAGERVAEMNGSRLEAAGLQLSKEVEPPQLANTILVMTLSSDLSVISVVGTNAGRLEGHGAGRLEAAGLSEVKDIITYGIVVYYISHNGMFAG